MVTPMTYEATPETTAWARMFAEIDKNDELSRDNNILRGDRDAYRDGVSYLVGMVQRLVQECKTDALRSRAMELAIQDVLGADALLDHAAMNAGSKAADRLIGVDEVLREERDIAAVAARERAAEKHAKAAAAKQSQRRHGHRMTDLRLYFESKLAARHGFETLDAMYERLGPPSGDAKKWRTITYLGRPTTSKTFNPWQLVHTEDIPGR